MNIRTLLLSAISLTAIAVAMYFANTTDDFEVSNPPAQLMNVASPSGPAPAKTLVADKGKDKETDKDSDTASDDRLTADRLLNTTLDTTQSAVVRREALYKLSQMGESAIHQLKDVAASSFDTKISSAHSWSRGAVKLERTLRISALEALDNLSHKNP